MRVGFIGLGAMGRHMAANLHQAGLLTSVFNRTFSKAEAFAKEAGCMAREAAPDEVAPVLVTQAEMQLKNGQFEAARETLRELDATGHQNPRGLLLLARLYRQSGEFEKLRALESKLRGARGIRPAAVDELMDQAYLEMLRVAAESGDAERLERAWNDASKPATRRPDIVLSYARGAMNCRNHEAAERVLRDFLDDEWNDALAALYGELELPDPLEPLAIAEKWLRPRREDPVLLVSCARLSIRAELYGKARSYLETSLMCESVLGERTMPDLAAAKASLKPGESIDIVDVFRRPQAVPAIVDDCVRLGLKALWLQLGVIHEAAAERARAAGMFVVMDLCIYRERAALEVSSRHAD